MYDTAWKVPKYGAFSGSYFPVFGLNTEIYGVNLRIQSEYRKIPTRKSSVFGQFSRIAVINLFWTLFLNLTPRFKRVPFLLEQFFPVSFLLVMLKWSFQIKFLRNILQRLLEELDCNLLSRFLEHRKNILYCIQWICFTMHWAVFIKTYYFFVKYFALTTASWTLMC